MIRFAIHVLSPLLVPTVLHAQSVVRHKLPNHSSFPIAAAVEVPAGKTMVYLSGKVPSVADAKADKNSVAAYGSTEVQTLSVLSGSDDQLKGMGMGMGDVVRMQVFLVGDVEAAAGRNHVPPCRIGFDLHAKRAEDTFNFGIFDFDAQYARYARAAQRNAGRLGQIFRQHGFDDRPR